MNEDAADRQGPLHAGGHWRDTAGLSHEGSDRQTLPACIQSAASSSASEVHEVTVSRGLCSASYISKQHGTARIRMRCCCVPQSNQSASPQQQTLLSWPMLGQTHNQTNGRTDGQTTFHIGGRPDNPVALCTRILPQN